jgi:predicted aspartyl protease
MTGRVDDDGRPLLPITVRHPYTGVAVTVDAWIDTAFTGSVLLLSSELTLLALPGPAEIAGVLADGSQVTLQAYMGVIDWFGASPQIDVLAGAGRFALVGIALLKDLVIDYVARQVTLTLATGNP